MTRRDEVPPTAVLRRAAERHRRRCDRAAALLRARALIIGQIGLHACNGRRAHGGAAAGAAPGPQRLGGGRADGACSRPRRSCWRCAPGAWPTAMATTGRCAGGGAVDGRRAVALAVACARGRSLQFAVLCVAAMLTGAGANIGLIAIQRTAGRRRRDATERMRVFSWLGLAPALSNVVGPVLAGFADRRRGLSRRVRACCCCCRW